MIKKDIGITIITLVITIIILLILAGISIATLVGNDGLINKAKKAAKDYENAQELELAQLNSILEYSTVKGDLENETGNISDDKYEVLIQEINALKNKVQTLENNEQAIDKIYPVGSVYISTDLSTAEAVNQKFGGTWEKYGQGRTIIGEGTGNDGSTSQTFTSNSTGGEYNHTLSIAEMPSHTHMQNPHGHKVAFDNNGNTSAIGLGAGGAEPETSVYTNWISGGRAWTMYTHSVTATNQNTGGSQPHNNIQPYIAVYMWKRVS